MPAATPHLPSTARRGYRTFLEALDELIVHEPDRLFASVPKSNDLSQGYDDVHIREVGAAVDAFAHWLLDWCGGMQGNFERIAYMGANDLRYSMVFLGAAKCGKMAMFLSPHNNDKQTAGLIEATGCTRFLYSREYSAKVEALKSVCPSLNTFELKPFNEWSNAGGPAFTFDRPYEKAKWDPILTLHSSGSTGDPKPITLPNGYFAANLDRAYPPVPGRLAPGHRMFDFDPKGKYIFSTPPFHLSGIMAQVFYPLFAQRASSILMPPTRPPTPVDIRLLLDIQRPRCLVLAPSFAEAIAGMPGGLDALCALDFLVYTGGPLSSEVGNTLAPHVQLVSFYGSCENGIVPFVMPTRDSWDWLEIHPAFHPTMEPFDDGRFELVLRRTGDPAVDEVRGTFWTEPDEQEHHTKDLFVKHPSKEGLWRFSGRRNDIIIMASGDKANPVPAESIILGCPGVAGCMLVGNHQTRVGLVLEARKGEDEQTLLREVQPYIAKANEGLSHIARISQTGVVPVGTLLRAPKGTVVRKTSEAKLAGLVEQLCAPKT